MRLRLYLAVIHLISLFRSGMKTAAAAVTQATGPLRRSLSSIPVTAVTVLLVFSGCGDETAAPVDLTNDQVELNERGAIERLKEAGCDLREADDPLMGTPGFMVTLFDEHITSTGRIRSEVFSQFRYLRKLFLIVDGTSISVEGLSQLRHLNNLLLLSAQRTKTDGEGLAQIEGIVSLRLLRLNRTLVTDKGLRHIERLPHLAMLYLSNTRVTDDVVPHIKGLKSLKALQLSHTGISDKGLAELDEFADLTHLGLNGTSVSDKSIEVLKRFKSLQYLNVVDAKLTAEGIAALRAALPECRVVSLAKARVPLQNYTAPLAPVVD